MESNMWKAYAALEQDPTYQYGSVNHSKNFVDPDTGVHTQTVESYWGKTKLKFKSMKGVDGEQLPSYLDDRMWRDRYGRTKEQAYHSMIDHISQIPRTDHTED